MMAQGSAGGVELPPSDEIWYISSNGGYVSFPYGTDFTDQPFVSNTYENGKGILKFASTILKTSSPVWADVELDALYFPDTLTTVQPNTFLSTSIRRFYFGSRVRYIYSQAFAYTNVAYEIYIQTEKPPVLDPDTFDINLVAIYVPAEYVERYKLALYWSNYADIIQSYAF